MNSLLIYGHADDLIQIEGSITAETSHCKAQYVPIIVNEIIIGHMNHADDKLWHYHAHPAFVANPTEDFTVTVRYAAKNMHILDLYPHTTRYPGDSDHINITGGIVSLRVGDSLELLLPERTLATIMR